MPTTREIAQRVARDALAQHAAKTVFAGRAVKAAAPRMPGGLGRDMFVRDADGTHATDPVTLNRIPLKRAVKIGKQYHNSKSLRAQLQFRNTNPLTRQPFPAAVQRKYGPRRMTTGRRPVQGLMTAVRSVYEYIALDEGGYGYVSLSDIPIATLRTIVQPYGVSASQRRDSRGEQHVYLTLGDESAKLTQEDGAIRAEYYAGTTTILRTRMTL